MRTSYTVTLPEEPPASPFPALAKELRPRSPLSPSLLLSTFVGLLLNKAKVRGAPFRDPHPKGLGFRLLPGTPPPPPSAARPRPGRGGGDSSQSPPSFPRVSRQGMPPPQVISGLLAAPSPC